MSKPLDFNKLKKKYMTVILPDEKNTTLMVTTPSKAVLDSFLALRDTITDDDVNDDAIDELYSICAKIMSRNKMGVEVTVDMIQDLFDFEDIIIFIRAYTDFISEVSNSKN